MPYKKITPCLLLLFFINPAIPMQEWIKEHPLATVTGSLVLGGVIGYSIAKSNIPTISLSDFVPDFSPIIDTITPSFNDNLDHVYALIKEDKHKTIPKFIFPPKTPRDDKALFIACAENYSHCAEELLKKDNINVNISAQYKIQSYFDSNPFDQALHHDDGTIIKLLLQHKNIRLIGNNFYRGTALNHTCSDTHTKVVPLLLEAPVDNIPDNYWSEPLEIACNEKKGPQDYSYTART